MDDVAMTAATCPTCERPISSRPLSEFIAELRESALDERIAIARLEGVRLGIEAAASKVRGSNADLCKSPGAAYRTAIAAITALDPTAVVEETEA